MRKIVAIFFLFSVVLSIVSLSQKVFAVSSQTQLNERILVRFTSSASEDVQNDIVNKFAIIKKEKLKLHNALAITIPRGVAQNMIKQLGKLPHVQYAEMDQIAQAFDVPNDPSYSIQWGLQKIQAPGAWDMTHSSSQSAIAIIDSGIDAAHPDLAGHIIQRVNFTTDSDIDTNGHGSHVAGIASGVTNNSMGIAGVGYNSSLISVKVLDSTGSGYYSWIANGIIWAADNGVKIINLSLGGSAPSSTLQNAVEYAANKGVIIIASAGNGYGIAPTYPANYPQVISVAATDSSDKKASFSTYGNWVTLAAPGVSIYSTYKGGYAYLSGTSMASPFVSGLASLIRGLHPDWSASEVINKIETTADSISGTGMFWKYGRINACKAVDCVPINPTPTTTPTITPTVTPTITQAPTITPISSPTPTVSPTPKPTLAPTAVPTITPTPTISSKPWWCIYAPLSIACK